jgi:hypothetical protein
MLECQSCSAGHETFRSAYCVRHICACDGLCADEGVMPEFCKKCVKNGDEYTWCSGCGKKVFCETCCRDYMEHCDRPGCEARYCLACAGELLEFVGDEGNQLLLCRTCRRDIQPAAAALLRTMRAHVYSSSDDDDTEDGEEDEDAE